MKTLGGGQGFGQRWQTDYNTLMVQLPQIEQPEPTEIGSYFVANYPPFSAWSAEYMPDYWEVLDSRPTTSNRSAPPTAMPGTVNSD